MNDEHRDVGSQKTIVGKGYPIPVPTSMPQRTEPVPPPPRPTSLPPSPPQAPLATPPSLVYAQSSPSAPSALPHGPSEKTPVQEPQKAAFYEGQVASAESHSVQPSSLPKMGAADGGGTAPSTKTNRTLVVVLVAVAVVASGAGGIWVYQENIRKAEEQVRITKQEEERKHLAEEERKRKAEAELKAKVEAEARALAEAQTKAETDEQARLEMAEKMRQMEEQSAQLVRQQQELQRRQQQIEQQKASAPSPVKSVPSATTGTTVTPSSPIVQNSGVTPGQQESKSTALDPRSKCATKDNFISKNLCESKACLKPEYSSHPYCERFR